MNHTAYMLKGTLNPTMKMFPTIFLSQTEEMFFIQKRVKSFHKMFSVLYYERTHSS